MVLLTTACLPCGRTKAKIPFEEKPAALAGAEKVFVVVLPGRGDGVANLKASGIAEAIQNSMPEADIALTGISLAYYIEGRMPQRLRAEIILPVREGG
jgi:hypothetical protein